MMKKCIVLDLDNTLWGGIIGEDGIKGISLSLQSPGNSFLSFQQALLDYYNRGVILAINSRNNPEDAWDVIDNHPNMILKKNHFAASRINWNDKASNIKELADELNIGLDSLVFIDDDKTNRELVRALLPEVEVPELPLDPKDYTHFLHSLTYLDAKVVTDEDMMRGNLYVTERLRKEQEKSFSSKEEFLTSLQLQLRMYKNDASCLSRLAQLTEKTNQFNTLKQPFSPEEIQKFMISEDYDVYYGSLRDIFGDYGVILFALVEKRSDTWTIQSLLMSCRVFGRDVETAFLGYLLSEIKQGRRTKIAIDYEHTDKNIPAKDFIDTYFRNFKLKIGSTSISSPVRIVLG